MSDAATKKQSSRVAQVGGLVLAATGLAHFASPGAFESITKSAFPRNTRQHIYINGSLETAIGVGLISPKTRTLALIGGAGYLAYTLGNAARNR
ncbi:hypothetical protein BH09ACT7_BH09ACT7_43120 [soil metagenome]